MKVNKTCEMFSLTEWNKTTAGGLVQSLSKIYCTANSAFEYGLGKSTYITNHVGVQQYAGIDSDAPWVAMAQDKISSHFLFCFADLRPIRIWDSKSPLDYQATPLIVESLPFDIYMVNRHWRLACWLLSILQGSAGGADHSKTIVLLHDSISKHVRSEEKREIYLKVDHLRILVDHSGKKLCLYQHKPDTTN
jgi:hypothetical protein